jgi:hypothetical protein
MAMVYFITKKIIYSKLVNLEMANYMAEQK